MAVKLSHKTQATARLRTLVLIFSPDSRKIPSRKWTWENFFSTAKYYADQMPFPRFAGANVS
jgi:hypothetical protein